MKKIFFILALATSNLSSQSFAQEETETKAPPIENLPPRQSPAITTLRKYIMEGNFRPEFVEIRDLDPSGKSPRYELSYKGELLGSITKVEYSAVALGMSRLKLKNFKDSQIIQNYLKVNTNKEYESLSKKSYNFTGTEFSKYLDSIRKESELEIVKRELAACQQELVAIKTSGENSQREPETDEANEKNPTVDKHKK